MEKNLITYRKGEYQILLLDTDDGHISFRLRTNSLESLDKLVERMKTQEFELSSKIPHDIREMLLKYNNVSYGGGE